MLHLELFNHCKNELANNLELLEVRERELRQALSSDHKSSAGDKHETGRAMIQLDREKLGEQIKKIEKQQQVLFTLKKTERSSSIGLGSIVMTSKANYYISVAVGSCIIASKTYYCISAQSPIGSLLLGKKVGDSIQFNMQLISIKKLI